MLLKRITAYLIDMIIVMLASSMLASISYINPQLDNYNKIYNEYTETYDKYTKKEITEDEYKVLLEDYNYELEKNNISTIVISIITIITYFTLFQKFNNGQTLGKRIMKIKVADNLSIWKYLLRTLILYNVIFNLLKIILIFTISKENYLIASNILYVGALVVETTTLILVNTRPDNKGLHDLIAGSKVVSLKEA